MYLNEILWLIAWPVLIFVSYRLILAALKKFEKKQGSKRQTPCYRHCSYQVNFEKKILNIYNIYLSIFASLKPD